MSSVIFGRYNNLPEACVIFSVLEAGGFHPTFQNYHHAHIAALELIAFGGIILALPEQEFAEAKNFLDEQQATPITDFDPMKVRRFGMWKRGTIFCLSSGLFLPYFFLAPEVLIVIWIAFFAYTGFQIASLTSFWLFIPLMLLHAKYVALPKLRQANEP